MVSEQDIERLSAYIDRELSPDEQAALEERLQREPNLRRELDALRITVQAIRDLPTMQAPRDFTLTPEAVGATPRFLMFPATPLVSVLSSVAAALLLVSGGLLLFESAGLSGGATFAPMSAELAVQPTLGTQALELSATQQTTASPMPQITATVPMTLDDAAGADAGDMDMVESPEMEMLQTGADEAVEMETEEEVMAESAEEADALFDDETTERDTEPPGAPAASAFAFEPTLTQESGLGRSAADDAGDLGAVPGANESVQLTVPASPLPAQQPTLAPTRPPATATPAAIAQLPPSEDAPPPRQLPAPSPIWLAGLLLVLGVLSVVVALGTAIQRRRNRGGT